MKTLVYILIVLGICTVPPFLFVKYESKNNDCVTIWQPVKGYSQVCKKANDYRLMAYCKAKCYKTLGHNWTMFKGCCSSCDERL